MAVKTTPKKNPAAGPTAITGDADKDIALAKCWMDFRSRLAKFFEDVEEVEVELQFESSYDDKTHHTFNADEAVFVSDIKVCPANTVVFIAPYGPKDKSFHYSEAELINVTSEGKTEQLNSVIDRHFSEAFKEFSDIKNVTFLERKYLVAMAGLGPMFNDAENHIKNIELNKDRSTLYSKLDNYGIF
jgi:hypothetical protein